MGSPYIKDDQGGTFIAATQRPDGSWRKPRRVRDGYVPQEEVPLYESKGKQFTKNQPTYPVGMSAEYVAERKAKNEAQASKISPIPGLVITNDPKKKKKKNKSKSVDGLTEDLAKVNVSKSLPNTDDHNATRPSSKTNGTNGSQEDSAGALAQQTTDPVKRLKNLKKKLREIESLEQKVTSGEMKNPDKEILEKISRKKHVQRDIKVLEDAQ